MVTFALAFKLGSATHSAPDILNSLVNATVQLFGFGGVIFAVLHHEQRSMLAKHREAVNRGSQAIINDTTAPVFQRPKASMKDEAAKLRTGREAFGKGVAIYMAGRQSFSLGFVALGIGLILQLIQRVEVNATVACNLFFNGLLLSTDIGLIAVGVSSFIFAIVRSMDLPLEPVIGGGDSF